MQTQLCTPKVTYLQPVINRNMATDAIYTQSTTKLHKHKYIYNN